MAGAREKFPDQPEESSPSKPASKSAALSQQPVHDKDRYGKDPVLLVSAIIALASLAVCIILPLWTYFSGGDGYADALLKYKHWLIWPTVIYFFTATIWNIKRSRN